MSRHWHKDTFGSVSIIFGNDKPTARYLMKNI